MAEQTRALLTLTAKEVKRFLRIWVQTLVPPVISIVLYFLIFGALIGTRIGEMAGRSYMEFIMPGLIMLAVINNAYANVASSFYSNKFQRSVEVLITSPMPNYLLLSGFMMGGLLRGLIIAALVTLVALLFVDVQIYSWLITLSVMLLTAMLFSLAGFLNGLLADKFDDVSIVPTFILTPLTYLGGVFYDIDLLSGVWRTLSYFNPVVYMVSSFRYGFFGDIGSISIGFSLSMLVFFSLFFWIICLYSLKKGVGLRA